MFKFTTFSKIGCEHKARATDSKNINLIVEMRYIQLRIESIARASTFISTLYSFTLRRYMNDLIWEKIISWKKSRLMASRLRCHKKGFNFSDLGHISNVKLNAMMHDYGALPVRRNKQKTQ